MNFDLKGVIKLKIENICPLEGKNINIHSEQVNEVSVKI